MKNIKTYMASLNEAADQGHLNRMFFDAANSGLTEVVSFMIDQGAQIDALDDLGFPALINAVTKGQTEVVKLLLDRGADVNVRDEEGWTPLHSAASHNKKDIAGILIDRGADIDAVDGDGWTPLRWAAKKGHKHFAEILILSGADPFKAFKDPNEILEIFDGDIEWMPEDLKTKLLRMKKGKQAFGM